VWTTGVAAATRTKPWAAGLKKGCLRAKSGVLIPVRRSCNA